MALDLIFEGLLRSGADGAGGRVYEPSLARELPSLVTLGREFTLTNATWADPEQPNIHTAVTAADVVSTVQKLAARRGQPGAEVADWIAGVTTAADKECRITLTRGHIDPLSLMTFKVMPAKQTRRCGVCPQTDRVGSIHVRGTQDDGWPGICDLSGESRLQSAQSAAAQSSMDGGFRNPLSDWKGGLIHFAVTTNTNELADLKGRVQSTSGRGAQQAGKLEVNISNTGHVDTLFGRRIYFLAINHQVQALGGDKGRDLRKFLATPSNGMPFSTRISGPDLKSTISH